MLADGMSKISRSLAAMRQQCQLLDSARRRTPVWHVNDNNYSWEQQVEWQTVNISQARYYYILDRLEQQFKLTSHQCTDEYYELTTAQLHSTGVSLPPDVQPRSINYRTSTKHDTMHTTHRIKVVYGHGNDLSFDVVVPEVSVCMHGGDTALLAVDGLVPVTRTKTIHCYQHPLMTVLCIMTDAITDGVARSRYTIKVRTRDSDIISLMSFLSEDVLETVYGVLCLSPLPYTRQQADEVRAMADLSIVYPTIIDLSQYAAITDGYVSLKADGRRMRMVITNHGLYLLPIMADVPDAIVMRMCAASATSPRQISNLYDGQQYSMFHGTVCDVEWLENHILVLDVLRYATTDEPSHHPYPDDLQERLSLINALVPYFPITIRSSHLFAISIGTKTEAVSMVIAAMKQCYYPTDGLVFRSYDGTKAYKFKRVPSVDLLVSGGQLIVLDESLSWRDSQLEAYGIKIAPPTTMPLTSDVIAEFDIHGSKWVFKRWRYDKRVPNTRAEVTRYIAMSLRYPQEIPGYEVLLSDEVVHAVITDDVLRRIPEGALVMPWMTGLVSLLAPPQSAPPLPVATTSGGDSAAVATLHSTAVAVATVPLTAAVMSMCRTWLQQYQQLLVITYDVDAIGAMVRYATEFELVDGHTISGSKGLVIDGIAKQWYSVNQLIKSVSDIATVKERWYYGTLPVTLGLTLDGQVKCRMLCGVHFTK